MKRIPTLDGWRAVANLPVAVAALSYYAIEKPCTEWEGSWRAGGWRCVGPAPRFLPWLVSQARTKLISRLIHGRLAASQVA